MQGDYHKRNVTGKTYTQTYGWTDGETEGLPHIHKLRQIEQRNSNTATVFVGK